MPDDLSHIAHLFLSTPDSPPSPLTLRALLAQHLPDADAATKGLAQHLARQLGSAALLRLRHDRALLQVFSTSQIQLTSDPGRSAQSDSPTLCQALSELPQHSNLLLVDLDLSDDLLAQCPRISVLASPQPTTVVAAYSLLKQLAPTFGNALGITMVDCPSVAQGHRIAQRLTQAAKEFLSLTLRLEDIVPDNSRLKRRKLAQAHCPDRLLLSRTIRSHWRT